MLETLEENINKNNLNQGFSRVSFKTALNWQVL